MPARHPGLDPLVEAQVVERLARGCEAVVESWKGCRRQVLLNGAPDRIEIDVLLRGRVVATAEEVGFGRMDRLRRQQVDRRDLEPAGEPEDRLVFAVDQFAAVLAGLAVQPGRGVRVHAAAHSW